MTISPFASVLLLDLALLPPAFPQVPQKGGPGLQATDSIGFVDTMEATVRGDLVVVAGRAMLVGASTVVAKDRATDITLHRGGSVRVCATSGLHLSHAQPSAAQSEPPQPQLLMLALDRGAIEIHTDSIANDVVITPDLRVSIRAGGPLDLRLRVTPNGDTCVENRGNQAPVLEIADPFTDATYQVRPGQHVLFEHGSLKEVVDHETSPCGCPEPTPALGLSVAEALLAPGTPAKTAAEHPFPAAVSQGLEPPPPIPHATPGEAHAQVAATLGFSADGSGTIAGAPTPAPAPPVPLTAPAQPSAPKPGFTHRVGRFFKHLFGGR